MNNSFFKFVACAFVLATTSPVFALGNAEVGKTKAVTCVACHGEAGAKPIAPEYPVLAGQNYDYLIAAMQQYKSGKRKNIMMTTMGASLYTAKEINDLAAYFASQPSPLNMKY